MIYALDSNVIIHLFQGKGKVRENLDRVTPAQVAIPSIVLFEVERGVINSQNSGRRRAQLDELRRLVSILPFDDGAALVAARLTRDLEKAGQKIGDLDSLIAGTVLAHNATLVTHNQREFQRVPGLRTVDWFD